MSDGYDPHTAYGAIDGVDDPSMGWARSVVGAAHMTRYSFGLSSVSPLCLDICSPHTNKLDGVMPRVLHGLKAVQ